MRKKIIGLTAAIVAVLLVVTAVVAFDINPFKKKQTEQTDNYFTKTIQVKEAETGDIKNSISSKGSISLQNTDDIEIPVNAAIEKVNVQSGSRVNDGDILAVLDTDKLQEEYDRVYDEWLKAKTELGGMKPTYDKIKVIATQKGKVVENNLTIKKNTEDILNGKESLLVIESDDEKQAYSNNVPTGQIVSISRNTAKGRTVKPGDLLFIVKVENTGFNNQVKKVNDLETQLSVLEQLIKEPHIKAETNAIITSVSVNVGSSIEKDTVIMKIEPTNEFFVKISITKDELRNVSFNKNARVTLDSGKELDGNISHISYSANDQGKFDMTIKLSDTKDTDPNDILPGLKAEVDIVLQEKLDVVKVPVDAIKTDGKGEYVLVYTGKAEDINNYTVDTIPTEKRYIEKGMVTSMDAEIISGVTEGEKVVVVTVSKNENESYGNMIGF